MRSQGRAKQTIAAATKPHPRAMTSSASGLPNRCGRCEARKSVACRPRPWILRLMPDREDRENDNVLGVVRVKDRIRELFRKRPPDSVGYSRRRGRPFRNAPQRLPNRYFEAFRDRWRLLSVPRGGFVKLVARFRTDDDASVQSAPKIFRSTDSHGSLSSGDAWCTSRRL